MNLILQQGGQTAVIDTAGGELVSYQDAHGLEYIWHGDSAYWSGRNPILFPIVGALRDGHVTAFGKACAMPQHGFARHKEFTVVEQGVDFAVLELCEDAESLAAYPFPFRLRVGNALKEHGFTTTIEVVNTGTEPMPFCLGAHTAFRCPLQEGAHFEDYHLVFQQEESLSALLPVAGGLMDRNHTRPCLHATNTLALEYAVFDAVNTLVLEGLRSTEVRLVHKESGRGLSVDFSGFPMLALWTPPGTCAPFLCIEPWQGGSAFVDESGRLEDKPHAVLLAPSETWRISYCVTTL